MMSDTGWLLDPVLHASSLPSSIGFMIRVSDANTTMVYFIRMELALCHFAIIENC